VRSLFDVSILIALLDPDHIHHGVVQSWWGENSAPGWASCPITQNGFVRIVSQPVYGSGFTAAEAIERLADETSRASHQFWPDDIAIVDSSRFNHRAILGSNQITDVYLIGLAVTHSGRFVTLDRGASMSAVKMAAPENLVILS
jgi:uncharacterized protein